MFLFSKANFGHVGILCREIMRWNVTYLGEAWVVGKPIGEMVLRKDGEVGALRSRRGNVGGGFEEVGFRVEGLEGLSASV